MKHIHADLVIEHATIITMDPDRRVIDDGILAISDGRIAYIGTMDSVKVTAEKTIDARGKYLFPGFVSTHTHLFQTMLKGLGRDKALFDWLDSSVRRALKNFDEETIHSAALTGLTEAIRTGTTTVTDSQYCHNKKGMDEAVIQAYQELGVRCVMSKSHTNVAGLPQEIIPDYVETEDDHFRELDDLCRKYRDDDMVNISLAPGIIWDHGEAGYRRTREFADAYNVPITMHLVETEEDDEYTQKTYGMGAIDLLEKCGVLGPDFVAVHAVHVTDRDIARFRDYDVKVSHCPVSNMILASGCAPVPKYLENGITVSLACDGAASNDAQDMLEVLKQTALIHKLTTRDASLVTASQVLEMATIGGAKALGLDDEIGSLEVGKYGDMFIWDPLKNSRSIPMHDPISTLVYSSNQANIVTTIIQGKIVLEDGVLQGASGQIDETDMLIQSQRLGNRLIKVSGLGNRQWGQTMSGLSVPIQG